MASVNWSAVGPWLVNNLVALLALALSAWAILRQYLGGRRALITAWFALTPTGRGMSDRLVVINHGPAAARDIIVTFKDEAGEVWEGVTFQNPFPIPLLAAGDPFHVRSSSIHTDGPYLTARIEWKDGRCGTQVRVTTLSLLGAPIGDWSEIGAKSVLSQATRGV